MEASASGDDRAEPPSKESACSDSEISGGEARGSRTDTDASDEGGDGKEGRRPNEPTMPPSDASDNEEALCKAIEEAGIPYMEVRHATRNEAKHTRCAPPPVHWRCLRCRLPRC